MRERLNWWWFFVIAGIIIPVANSLFTHFPFVYRFFDGLLESGLNPYLGDIFNLIVILLICVFFKITSWINLPTLTRRVLYCIAGFIVTYLFLGFLIPRHVKITETPVRAYKGLEQSVSFEHHSFIEYMGYSILALVIFIFFFKINFPEIANKKPPVINSSL